MWKLIVPVSLLFLPACATMSGDQPADEIAARDANEAVLVIRRSGNRFVEQRSAGDISDNEQVCRVAAPTGTRIKEVVCRSQREWEAIQAEGRRFMELRQTGTADSQ